MPQQPTTFLLRGGLDLITPQIAMPNGRAIGGVNYEPDINGVTRLGGLERFDGHARPSDSDVPATIAARRAAISAVPGTGPVRGGAVFAGAVYAFRDKLAGGAGMYVSTASGWSEVVPGYILWYTTGTAEFVEGEVLAGGTSAATATIARLVLQTGTFSGGDATGYLVLTNIVGTFTAETITSTSGSATSTTLELVALDDGGKYDAIVHNFYGAAKQQRLYFVNGETFGFEYSADGWLAPIHTGTTAGALEEVSFVLEDDGDFIVLDNGNFVVLDVQFDKPSLLAEYKNQLFLAYRSGAVINSGVGEPLDYRTATGAGEIDFGSTPTGLLNASTSLMIFARDRIDYLTGSDISDFVLNNITKSAGAVPYSVQLMKGPTYVDDGGVRDVNTSAAFGDWRAGTLSQMVEPLMRAKRDAGVSVVGTLKVKGKDQYRLFWDDGTGLCMYVGRKDPESLPFNLVDIVPFSMWAGETDEGMGERYFIGAEDGYVYELDRGLSFDGDVIPAYLRLAFNQFGSPGYNKRFHGVTFGTSAPDAFTISVTFDIDYATGLTGALPAIDASGGQPIVTTDLFADIDFTQVMQGNFYSDIDGLGENLAVTLATSSAVELAHTFTHCKFKWSARGLVKVG